MYLRPKHLLHPLKACSQQDKSLEQKFEAKTFKFEWTSVTEVFEFLFHCTTKNTGHPIRFVLLVTCPNSLFIIMDNNLFLHFHIRGQYYILGWSELYFLYIIPYTCGLNNHLKVEFTQKCKFSHHLLTLMSFLLSSVEHGDIVNNSGKHTVLVPIDFHYIFIHTMEDSGNRNCLFINNLLLLCFSFGWVGEWWHNSHFLSGLSL